MDNQNRGRLFLQLENELMTEEITALVQAPTFPILDGSSSGNIIPTDLTPEDTSLLLENALLRSNLERLTFFVGTLASCITIFPAEFASYPTWLFVVLVMSSLSHMEIDFLARFETPMWSDDGRLNLNEYYSILFPWYARNVPGFVHEVSRASGLVTSNAFKLVTNLMDPGHWQQMFPSIIANVSTESRYNGFLVVNMDFMPIISPTIQPWKVKLLRSSKYIGEDTWSIVDICMYFTSYTGNSRPTFLRFPSGYIVKHVSNYASEVTVIDHWVYEQGEAINFNPNFGFGAHRWLEALKRHCYNACETWDHSIGHHIQTFDPIRSTNLLNLSSIMVYQFCTGVCGVYGVTGLNWSRLNMDGVPNNDLTMFTQNYQDMNGDPCLVVSATGFAGMQTKAEDVFRSIKGAKKKDIWNIFHPIEDMTEVIRIKRGGDSENEVSVFRVEEEGYLIQETHYEATSAMIIHARVTADLLKVAINGGMTHDPQFLPFGFVIMPYGLDGCIVSAGVQAVGFQGLIWNADQLICSMVKETVSDTLRNVANVVGVHPNLP